jgi:hypothetical protein
MKYKAVCPGCQTLQKRSHFFEPFLHSVNSCRKCGTSYKGGKFSLVYGSLMGLFAGLYYNFAEAQLLPWTYGTAILLLMLPVGIYISPYFNRLKHTEESVRVKILSGLMR